MSEFKNLPSGWKVVRLGEISSRVTRRNQDNRCQNVLTISAQSGLINQVDFFNKQVASKDLSNYILLKKGEFAYNKSYSTGYSFGAFKRLKFYEEGVASPLYIYFKFNDDVCSDFFEFYFDAGQANRQIKDIVQEGARNHGLLNLSIDDFFNIKIRMPNLDEQKKIAEILSTWDEAINLTINLIESKKQFKKALMQNLLTAKINWHTTTLSNVGEIITGSTPSTTNEKFWNGEVAWITPTDIGDKKDIFIGERSITQDGLKATRELPANSLLVTCIASIGKNAVLKVKGSCNQQINALIPNKNLNVDFLYYLLEFEQEKLKKLAGLTATLIIAN
uniref:restriction endonuclease subunit S n=1 Tax=Campylobacter concisus TaxID=199 RepID=UPI000CD91206